MSGITATKETDPLLRDLSEKKQSFWRNVVSLQLSLKMLELVYRVKNSRFLKSLTRQEAEARARNMEEDISRL